MLHNLQPIIKPADEGAPPLRMGGYLDNVLLTGNHTCSQDLNSLWAQH